MANSHRGDWSNGLTDKQAAFVDEYLVDLNGAKASIRAGYSKASARQNAEKLLRNPTIASAVDKRRADRMARTEITQDMVVRELAKIGFADIRKIFTAAGNLIAPGDLDDAIAGAIQSVEVVQRRTIGDEKHVEEVHKIRLGDKRAALVDIGKHLGMFTEKVEHSGKITVETLTDEELAAKIAAYERSSAPGAAET